jgi:SAM-dependent methyltransferase/alpha-beta hydrolase superfamily lysophospholipase
MIADYQTSDIEDIHSSRVSFPGTEGRLIVGYLDQGDESVWNGRFILLTPKYGETKKNNIRLAYFLVSNGFKVLRFDHTNHIGESDGDMSMFTLPGATEDILHALEYAENHFEPSEIILISNSLSARCAYRAVALDARIARVVCIVGVVNLQQTIKNIYQKDIIGTFCEGKEWGTIDILGFDIDSANFISKLAESDMHSLSGTLEDASKIECPLLHLHAAKDIWVDRVEVEQVVQRVAHGQLANIEGAYHEIGENPEAARLTMEQVTRFCLEGTASSGRHFSHPAKAQLFAQNRLERNRLKQIYAVKESENDFWNGYLGKFGTIEQASVYIDYFEKIGALIGTVKEGDVLIDAGCGNGFFGLCLLHSMESAIGTRVDFARRFVYYGLDLTPGGLMQAYSRQSQIKSKLIADTYDRVSGVTFAYQRFDFDRIQSGDTEGGHLPFADDSIDKICSSLVVSYLKDPVAFVCELRRVLKPGGVIVLSSMKPDCDMTVLYHEFISMESEAVETADSAQQLLGAAGKIKLKEQSGIYGFFSEEELISIVSSAGFKEYDSFRSLGNQANVIRVTK